MEWIDRPQSSNVARFAYEESNQVLKVEFKNGTVYDYYDIPDNVFQGMKSAPSAGQYLAQNVKSRFRYART